MKTNKHSAGEVSGGVRKMQHWWVRGFVVSFTALLSEWPGSIERPLLQPWCCRFKALFCCDFLYFLYSLSFHQQWTIAFCFFLFLFFFFLVFLWHIKSNVGTSWFLCVHIGEGGHSSEVRSRHQKVQYLSRCHLINTRLYSLTSLGLLKSDVPYAFSRPESSALILVALCIWLTTLCKVAALFLAHIMQTCSETNLKRFFFDVKHGICVFETWRTKTLL